MTSIRNKMATAAVWMVLAKLVERSLGLVSTLVLARVLIPHDFGIVAMAMTFVALIEVLTAFGFDTTLIQKQTKERVHWDTAWTFDILLGIGVAVLLVAGAYPVAAFFQEPALIKILPVLALGSVALGFQNIGVVAFRAEMRFDREFRFHIGKKLIGFAVTIPLALLLESYWALVIGQTAARFGGTALSYWVHPYRPRLTLVAARDLLTISKWLLTISFIGYLKERSSDWVIGRIAGPSSLGAFNVSYELASLPSSELAAPINRAVFPAYAKLAKEGVGALRPEYLSVISAIVLIAVPAVLGVAATAPLLIPVLLGPNWSQAIPVLTLLALFGFTTLVQSNAQAVYVALGRPDIPAKINGAQVVIQLVALIPLTKMYGVVGSAAAFLVTATIMIPLSLGVALRMLSITVFEFVREVWRPIGASLAMYVVVRNVIAWNGHLEVSAARIVLLSAAVAAGALIYVVLICALWFVAGKPDGAERMALTRIRQMASQILLSVTSSKAAEKRP